MTEFKPLEHIAQTTPVSHGDLILLRTRSMHGTTETPVFYGGLDRYVSDGSAGIEKDKVIEGIRVFHRKYGGKLMPDDGHNSVFYDPDKGLLIPFNYSGSRSEYSLLTKSHDLP